MEGTGQITLFSVPRYFHWVGYEIFVWSIPPHPNPLPKERAPPPRAQVAAAGLMRTSEGSPSPWGEVGVRGNVIDARNGPHICSLELQCGGTLFSCEARSLV